jgi:hypothetical protein
MLPVRELKRKNFTSGPACEPCSGPDSAPVHMQDVHRLSPYVLDYQINSAFDGQGAHKRTVFRAAVTRTATTELLYAMP